jgi:serine/threonine protein phosphatase PrpC
MGMADFMVLACDGLWDCMTNQQVRPASAAAAAAVG